MTQGIRVKKFCYHYLLPIIQLSGCCDIHNPFGVCIYNFQAETESRPNFVLIRTTFRKKKVLTVSICDIPALLFNITWLGGR